ncbi:MAG: ATP-dependent DNA helicase RecG [Caulobacteraceae bacterium]|nr:ATP-dependent DNA helicase RecG [Caulobacter sp.]
MRPEALFPLYAPQTSLKGLGPKLAPLVARAAGGELVRDLAFLSPTGLLHRRLTTIAEVREGELATLAVRIEAHLPGGAPGRPYRIRCADETGWVFATFFGGSGGPHLLKSWPVGELRAISGEAGRYGVELQLKNPQVALPEAVAESFPEVEAVYPTTAGLPVRTLRRFALEALARAPDLPEWQDAAWLARQGWPGWRAALEALHHPTAEADLDPLAPARARLAYDELLAHQLAMASRKRVRGDEPAPPIPASDLSRRIEAALPFRLTGAQRRTLAEVGGDLASGRRMTRLVQGDVGSGKTAVAMLAAADVAASGRQTALMAPTEILARQHYETLVGPLAAAGVRAVLLTGRDKGAGRAEKLAALDSGAAAVAVGTHALFQKDVAFADLALAVVDEQHRFGVGERRRLQEKGASVHLLALSATPIPRTLELTVFGDLDVSRLDEKPPGRQPVATTAAPSTRLPEIVARLKRAVAAGAQAFWICPLVEESETSDAAAAVSRAEELRAVLGPVVGLAHGRLPPAEKDATMAAFADGALKVLVATTVVEVGVNVPNATIMVIEHAERFGLAQLHQLRGRVGRGEAASACLLLYDPPLSAAGQSRLEILRDTDDGFLIAERDLELRGGGDLMGLKQSGLPAYRFADPYAHRALIPVAADDARLALARDPALEGVRGQTLRVLKALFPWDADDDGWSAAG